MVNISEAGHQFHLVVLQNIGCQETEMQSIMGKVTAIVKDASPQPRLHTRQQMCNVWHRCCRQRFMDTQDTVYILRASNKSVWPPVEEKRFHCEHVQKIWGLGLFLCGHHVALNQLLGNYSCKGSAWWSHHFGMFSASCLTFYLPYFIPSWEFKLSKARHDKYHLLLADSFAFVLCGGVDR